MRLLAPLAVMALLAGPALATQEYILPTLFDVSGVAPDDVLNIRERPDAGSPVIGRLAPDAKGVEVVEERRGWARVNMAEASGWVSSRYLSYRTDVWEPGALPAHFRCLGTEPFWGFAVKEGRVEFSQPEQTETQELKAVLDNGVFRHPARSVLGEDLTLVAQPQQCSDGMSDRVYGMTATLIRHGGQPAMLNGCCMIAAPDQAPD